MALGEQLDHLAADVVARAGVLGARVGQADHEQVGRGPPALLLLTLLPTEHRRNLLANRPAAVATPGAKPRLDAGVESALVAAAVAGVAAGLGVAATVALGASAPLALGALGRLFALLALDRLLGDLDGLEAGGDDGLLGVDATW